MTAFAGYLILAIPSWIIAVRRLPAGAPEPTPAGPSPAAAVESGPPWSLARHLTRPIFQLDLAQSTALPAPDAKFVVVRGYQVLDASYEYSKSLAGGGL